MMSSTVTTSSSVSNASFLTDSSVRYDSNQELKRRRKKLALKQFNNARSQPHIQRPERPTLYSQKNIANKHLKKSETHQDMRSQEVPVNSFNSIRRNSKSTESSEISSNNLTCSELDGNNGKTETRMQRRKYIKCVLREDIEMLKNLLAQQDIVSIRDKHKNTLMHIACGFGRLRSVQTLMKLCPKLIDQLDDKNHDPIDVAIKHGQLEVIKWLLSKTNKLNKDSYSTGQINWNQRSCLHTSAKHGENEILRFILSEMYKQQLSLDTQDSNGNTAAHLAAKYNNLDCLQTLVEFNCDITIVNKHGHTPCFVAEYYGNQECVHYLMIVETCINLSLKIVKIGRKLRETKSNNEVLKAQMDEAIAINNDFINQRENVMNISLDLMQTQINKLEVKVLNEIERLYSENKCLKESIEAVKRSAQTQNNLLKNVKNFNKISENNTSAVEIEIQFQKHSELCERSNLKSFNSIENIQKFESELSICKEEIIKTKQNCINVLKMDQKRLDSVKTRFNEIKHDIETTEVNTKVNISNCDNSDILETKEHFEILRKMYQETTHKLMIFRNALKDRNFMAQNQNNLTNSSNYSSNNSIKTSMSVTSSENNDYITSSSKSSNASTILNQMISNANSNYFTEQFDNNELSSNIQELEDEISQDPDDPSYIVDYKRRPISSTPTSLRTNLNNYNRDTHLPLKQPPNSNNFSTNSSNNEQQIYDYSSDDTLSDNEYQLDVDNDNENEEFSKSEENDYSNGNLDEKVEENFNRKQDQDRRNMLKNNYNQVFNSENENRNNQVYNHFYNQDLSNKKASIVNQKNNQIIIEEIDEDNAEKNQSHLEENEKLETFKNNTVHFNRNTFSNNSPNNLRSKNTNNHSTPFSYYRNGNTLNNNKNNFFLNENLNNNLILLSEDY